MPDLDKLAQESLRTYADEVGPIVASLRDRIDGPLGMALINGMEATERQAADNYGLVNDFVKLLPHLHTIKRTGGDTTGFTVESQSEALFLQNSILWAKTRQDCTTHSGVSWLHTGSHPFYVLGRRLDEGTESLLLVATTEDQSRAEVRSKPSDGTIQIRTYPKATVDAYHAAVQQSLGQVYSRSELLSWSGLTKRFYDKQTETFTICADSPRSMSAEHLPDSDVTQSSGILKAISRRGQARVPASGLARHHAQLSAGTLVDFDVLGGMESLATRFGVIGEHERLLANTPALKSS